MNTKSQKRKSEDSIYTILRKRFLNMPQNMICFIGGCGNRATTIEHTKGRLGYADQWARDNDISLYLDVRFWKGCCFECNGKLENDADLSHKYQLSKIHKGKKLKKK